MWRVTCNDSTSEPEPLLPLRHTNGAETQVIRPYIPRDRILRSEDKQVQERSFWGRREGEIGHWIFGTCRDEVANCESQNYYFSSLLLNWAKHFLFYWIGLVYYSILECRCFRIYQGEDQALAVEPFD